MYSRFTRSAAVLLCAAWVALLSAQEPPTASGPSELRAELRAVRTLLGPGQPVKLRFTLLNPTAAPIEFSVSVFEEADGVILPLSVIFGGEGQSALWLTHEQSDAVEVLPREVGTKPSRRVFRLGAGASIGATIDLRLYERMLRYPGPYRIEWKPLGGSVPAVSTGFRIEPRQKAVLVTDYGKITFLLRYDESPRNVENLLELLRERFYDGLPFHRIVPDFIIQGGSPTRRAGGLRPDGRLIPAEFCDEPFDVGTLAMARKPSDPDSASCQFFVCLARLPELDGEYTIVGQARDDESLRTLRAISEIPTDEHHVPRRPVTIRFFSLVEIEDAPVKLNVGTP